jgi:hypothetical protein
MTWQDDYYLGSSDYPITGDADDVDPVNTDDLAHPEGATALWDA